MQLSAAGLTLIKRFESCRLTAYKDQKGIWTIGWGHTGPEVVEGLTITQARAEDLLIRDTDIAVKAVNKRVKVELNQFQFDALVSFVYNLGEGAFAKSTMLVFINRKEFKRAAQEFEKWSNIRVNGKLIRSKGLLMRRQVEKELFLT